MVSSPVTSWQIEMEKVETVADFIFLDSKITVDGDCSHEIKKHLLLGGKKKSYATPRQRIKNQRHPFADTDGCESWTIKKAEHQRTDAFELWYWKRLLRVP